MGIINIFSIIGAVIGVVIFLIIVFAIEGVIKKIKIKKLYLKAQKGGGQEKYDYAFLCEREEEKKWLSMAAAQGYEPAKAKLIKIEKEEEQNIKEIM